MSGSIPWWQRAVFYQVYPRSFADANGDGIGDLPGLIARLDTLADLGVDAIWLSPHYPSPQFDCGYDISEYTAVHPEYGTLADFEYLLAEVHRRGMHLILDLVLNHTSDQHPWFQESRAGRDNPRRDWYVWAEGRGDCPPNDWVSLFGGSAWTLDSATGQYYYHCFFKQQPDLNWRNPEVQAAMFAAIRFWLDLGVDGFRLDAINHIFEDPALHDQGVAFSWQDLDYQVRTSQDAQERRKLWRIRNEALRFQTNQPGTHPLMQALRRLVDAYPDRVLIGETDDVRYHGTAQDELHLVFNFALMRAERLTPAVVRANQRQRLAALPPDAWPCNTFGNHDTTRVYTHFDDGRHADAWARISAALALTLRGTPFLYNGEEIGMIDLLLDDASQFRDMVAEWLYAYASEYLGFSAAEALAYAARFSRDRCRTPMQWTAGPNAGFCPPDRAPWLPVNPNHVAGVNVADQQADPDSLWHFYRRLLHARKTAPALQVGTYTPLATTSRSCLAFLRHDTVSDQRVIVALNMTDRARVLSLVVGDRPARLLFGSLPQRDPAVWLDRLALGPFEIVIVELEGESMG